ncbi:MAG: hypothetical protein HY089_03235 [Ignavibacteriales bacterium]|nr:hypothetical protein [Ignavibacteriales bacterium]
MRKLLTRSLYLQSLVLACAVSVYGQMILSFGLSAKISDSNEVELKWSAPREVTVGKYLIYRAPLGADQRVDNTKFVLRDSTSSMEYHDAVSDLKTQGYAYVVRARTNKGELSSNTVVVSIVVQPSLKLSASANGERVVTLNATANNLSNAKLYFYRGVLAELGGALSSSQLTLIDSVELPAHEVKDTTARRASAIYGYVVKAKVGTRTIESNLAMVNLITTPVKVSLALKVAADDSSRPKLTWTYSGPTVTMYYIYVASSSDPGMTMSPIALQKIDSTTQSLYTYRGALPSSGFLSFRVVAKTVAGTNVESNLATFYLSTKIKLSAYMDLEGNVKLKWTPVNVMATNVLVWYKIYRAAETEGLGAPFAFVLVDSTRDTEWKDRPTLPNVRSLSYYVETTVGGRLSRSDTAKVFWKTPPPQPFLLTGKVFDGTKVSLSWNQPSGFVPTKYYLYRAALVRNTIKFDSTAQFSLVDSTLNKELVNAPSLDQTNVFGYYVEARGGTNKARTNTLMVIFSSSPTNDKISITSDPPRGAHVGVLYTYQPKAKSSDSTATFKWLLNDKPTGMTIDTATGLTQWTPSVKGRFGVKLSVVSNKGGKASQEFYISVAGQIGIVQGTVTDTAGTP